MSMLKIKPKKYDDGMTKQSFKDSTDINKMLAKAQRSGGISHLMKYGATYGDFSEVDDLLQAQLQIQKGQEIFDDLPSEIKREFDHDMGAFFAYVNAPENQGRLEELLPDLAAPGRQLPAVLRSSQTEQNPHIVSTPQDPSENAGEAPSSAPAETPDPAGAT